MQSEEKISELREKSVKILKYGKQGVKKKKMRKSNPCLRHMWHIIKHVNICTVAVLEGEERGKGVKRFEK